MTYYKGEENYAEKQFDSQDSFLQAFGYVNRRLMTEREITVPGLTMRLNPELTSSVPETVNIIEESVPHILIIDPTEIDDSQITTLVGDNRQLILGVAQAKDENDSIYPYMCTPVDTSYNINSETALKIYLYLVKNILQQEKSPSNELVRLFPTEKYIENGSVSEKFSTFKKGLREKIEETLNIIQIYGLIDILEESTKNLGESPIEIYMHYTRDTDIEKRRIYSNGLKIDSRITDLEQDLLTQAITLSKLQNDQSLISKYYDIALMKRTNRGTVVLELDKRGHELDSGDLYRLRVAITNNEGISSTKKYRFYFKGVGPSIVEKSRKALKIIDENKHPLNIMHVINRRNATQYIKNLQENRMILSENVMFDIKRGLGLYE